MLAACLLQEQGGVSEPDEIRSVCSRRGSRRDTGRFLLHVATRSRSCARRERRRRGGMAVWQYVSRQSVRTCLASRDASWPWAAGPIRVPAVSHRHAPTSASYCSLRPDQPSGNSSRPGRWMDGWMDAWIIPDSDKILSH
jgi:hypothetical protein